MLNKLTKPHTSSMRTHWNCKEHEKTVYISHTSDMHIRVLPFTLITVELGSHENDGEVFIYAAHPTAVDLHKLQRGRLEKLLEHHSVVTLTLNTHENHNHAV